MHKAHGGAWRHMEQKDTHLSVVRESRIARSMRAAQKMVCSHMQFDAGNVDMFMRAFEPHTTLRVEEDQPNLELARVYDLAKGLPDFDRVHGACQINTYLKVKAAPPYCRHLSLLSSSLSLLLPNCSCDTALLKRGRWRRCNRFFIWY